MTKEEEQLMINTLDDHELRITALEALYKEQGTDGVFNKALKRLRNRITQATYVSKRTK